MIFWIPVLLFLIIGSIFITWRKNVVVLLFLLIPFLFFLLNVFDHHHYEPMSDLMYNLLGLALSTIAIIFYLLFQSKKK
ncbi:hypothetical protein EGX73_01590 [Enterococcus sp. FDAARGOS_553]|nr:hypothetical protein EGX73_01590 [Enterococcus sp. FDAARGOS_553]EEV31609.1 predicted protein [Enterococcus gallinarum EG2]EQC79811.1 hypothetical protein HSIEG1_1661 [Enterococcus sp. HSIEG1]KIL83247.1 hypothetical protein EH68_13080 [Enterococcus gallinarum]MBO6325957.1 hypothetical protein [Enterococcus gallinarum]